MSEVFFYHLTRSRPADTLSLLLEKSLAAGWRVLVRGTDPDRLAALDDRLWLQPEDGFLPHGMAGGDRDADQPILLTLGTDGPAGRQAVVSVDGAQIAADEVAQIARGMILFDGQDAAALAHARTQWRALTGAGIKAKYWSEETGKWQMKAES